VLKGLEPSTFCVTGRHCNHLYYSTIITRTGFEPVSHTSLQLSDSFLIGFSLPKRLPVSPTCHYFISSMSKNLSFLHKKTRLLGKSGLFIKERKCYITKITRLCTAHPQQLPIIGQLPMPPSIYRVLFSSCL
jgi:hypothetical protein